MTTFNIMITITITITKSHLQDNIDYMNQLISVNLVKDQILAKFFMMANLQN